MTSGRRSLEVKRQLSVQDCVAENDASPVYYLINVQ